MFKQWENTAMRLTTDQIQAIRQTAQRVLGAGARVSVFGSRALDNRKGGDIDLFFETDALLDNRAKVLCQLHGALGTSRTQLDRLLDPANPSVTLSTVAKAAKAIGKKISISFEEIHPVKMA